MSLKLNQYQKETVEHKDGPCLVTSCPGSGKTFTLVERIVNLIDSGVPQKNILCLTFTNKAANEMKERICKRLGIKEPKFFIGTFHSLCSFLIRRLGPGRGYSSHFTILDDKDQIEMIKKVARYLEHEISPDIVYEIMNKVNYYRDQMEDFEWVKEQLTNPIDIEIAETYIERCRSSDIIDFSGLIYEAIRLIENDEEVKRKIQNTFKYILVDETQDTNKAQFYLVNLLGGKWKNIMLIGDLDQCVIEGEKVLTPDGYKKIEDINKKEKVSSASGGGNVVSAIVANKYKKKVHNRPIIRLTTQSGFKMAMTKEHMIFADYVRSSPKKIIVYLMYDRDFGYRIGVTNTKRKHGNNGQGLGSRLQQERAEYLWILKSVDNIDAAKYWEQYFSVKYGVPTWCFYSDKKQRNLDYSDGSIKKLFSSIDTGGNANKLMDDLWLFKERPHYIPKCMGKNKRRNFTINMCADTRNGTLHRYMISGSESEDGDKLKKSGLNVRGLCKGRRGWRVESAWRSIDKIYDILELVKESLGEVNIIEKARFCEETLSLMPASHLREGMAVYVGDEKNVTIDYVKSIEFDYYNGNVYDIDVEDYHNFITNGIVSHNSIYGWRGARYQNIQEFMDMYEDCRVISLSKNYRSTPQIVNASKRLIQHNTSHMGTPFETDNPPGDPILCYSFSSQEKEAECVANVISKLKNECGWDYSDIAVLYRVNKMSEPVERQLAMRSIPYEVIGTRSFYDRREIKDAISMAKFLVNKKDGVAFNRFASLLDGMGAVTIGRIEKESEEKNVSILDVCKRMSKEGKSSKSRQACELICNVFDRDYNLSNPSSCIATMLDRFNYNSYLDKAFKSQAIERKDNLDQLVNSSSDFGGSRGGLVQFLQQITLLSNNDKENKDNKVTLMSLHAAKGLEFPIVFMIGVEKDILPHKKALEDDIREGLEEERRLCYVGMTRAKKVLYITWCSARKVVKSSGQVVFIKSKPSDFLKEAGVITQ